MHVGRQTLVGVSGEEAAQLLGELELAAAASADAQVLLDRCALGLVDESVEVAPELTDGLGAGDQAIGSRSMSLASAYSQS